MTFKKKILLVFLLIIICFLTDRISKKYILDFFIKNEFKEYYLNSFINFNLVWNKGVAFGLLESSNYIYNIISLLILIIIISVIYFSVKSKKMTEIVGFAFVSGGAIGNFFDRLYYNAVPDFIDLHYKNLHWFTFNVSDIWISIGIILVLIFDIFKFKIEKDEIS